MGLRLETVKSETVELYKIKLGRVLLVYSLICWGSRQADSWRYRLLKLTPVLCVNRFHATITLSAILRYTECRIMQNVPLLDGTSMPSATSSTGNRI